MRYDSVLFDLDGTLLDTLDDMTDAMNRTLAQFQLPGVTRAQVRSYVGNGARRLVEQAAPGLEGAALEALLKAYKEDYDAHYLVKTAPYPGVSALLETLQAQGVQIAVVSNKPDSTVRQLCDTLFPGVLAVGERQGIRRKPAPDMVLSALERLGSRSAVYVGDSDVDIATARNAALPCISVTWGFRDRDVLERSGATAFADTCEELLALLTGDN